MPATYRGRVLIKSDGYYAVIAAFGPGSAIGPCEIVGKPIDGDPCLILLDDQSRPWMIVNSALEETVVPPVYTPSNVTEDRTFNANATTIDELSDILGTLIADLKLAGLIEP